MLSLYTQVLENFQIVVIYWPPCNGENFFKNWNICFNEASALPFHKTSDGVRFNRCFTWSVS